MRPLALTLLASMALACGPSRIERLRTSGVEAQVHDSWTRLRLQDVRFEMPGVPLYEQDTFPMGRQAVQHERLWVTTEARSHFYEVDVLTPEPGLRFTGDEQLEMCMAQLRSRHGVTAEPEEQQAGNVGSWPTVDIVVHTDQDLVGFVRIVMTSYQAVCMTLITPSRDEMSADDQRFVRSLRLPPPAEVSSEDAEGVTLDVR